MKNGRTEEPTDEELIARIVAGEKDLFSIFIGRHQNFIYTCIMRQLGDPETSRDLAQDVLVRAYRGLGDFRGSSKASTWLYRITLNVVKSYFASRRWKERCASGELLSHHVDTLIDRSDETRTRETLLAEVRNAVGGLPETYREAVVLTSFEGKSYKEAGEILGLPVGTVCSRMNKALQLLKKKLRGKVQ